MRTISIEKMKSYLTFFETLRMRCKDNMPVHVRKLGTYLKLTPNLFYAAVDLGYFKKINKSCYQCSVTEFTESHVHNILKRSSERETEWQVNRRNKSIKESSTTTLAAPENPFPGAVSYWPKNLIKKEDPLPTMPPVFADVKAFAEMRAAKGCKRIDPMLFHAHYSATGWKIGKNQIKNWKAAFVTWERREFTHDPLSLKLCTKEAFEEEMKRRGYRPTNVHPTDRGYIANIIKTGNFLPGEAQQFLDLFTVQNLIAALKKAGVTGEIQYTTAVTEKL